MLAHPTTVGGMELETSYRVTAVLERRGAHWLFLQMHLSVADAREVTLKGLAGNHRLYAVSLT